MSTLPSRGKISGDAHVGVACVYRLTSALYFAVNNDFCIIGVPFVATSRLASLFPLRKFYAEQLWHTTSEAFQALKRLCETYIQYKIWIVGSARERDFTAQIVWWHCAIAHLGGNTG